MRTGTKGEVRESDTTDRSWTGTPRRDCRLLRSEWSVVCRLASVRCPRVRGSPNPHHRKLRWTNPIRVSGDRRSGAFLCRATCRYGFQHADRNFVGGRQTRCVGVTMACGFCGYGFEFVRVTGGIVPIWYRRGAAPTDFDVRPGQVHDRATAGCGCGRKVRRFAPVETFVTGAPDCRSPGSWSWSAPRGAVMARREQVT